MLSPAETAKNYVFIAQNKTSYKWYKTLILAVFAGIFIAVASMLATVAGSGYDGVKAILIKATVFPVGLILITLSGSELFTGNCLLLAPALSRDVKISAALKNLAIVYGGNFAGAILIALIAVFSGLMSNETATACVAAAAAKCEIGFFGAFLRAVPCNVLVCFAVLISSSSNSVAGKVLAVYPPIFTFVACGFEHSVANMYYLTSGLLTAAKYGYSVKSLTAGSAILNSLLPSTLGNIVGGMVFVAIPLWLIYFKKSRNSASD